MNIKASSMLYRLITLFTISTTPFPLSIGDINEIIVSLGYIDALTIQSIISDLKDEGLVQTEVKDNRTYLSLSSEGNSVLDALKDNLTDNIKEEIKTYIYTKRHYYINEHSIQTSIGEGNENEYIARLEYNDQSGTPLKIEIAFPTVSLAEKACSNFRKYDTDINKYIYEMLLK